MAALLKKISLSTIQVISVFSLFCIIVCRTFFAVESSYYDFAFQSISLYIFLNIYIIGLLFIVVYFNKKYICNFLTERKRYVLVFLYSLAISLLFLYCFKGTPQHDSEHCVEVADLIVKNDFFGTLDMQYLKVYPFQFGYSLVIAIFKVIFNENYLIALQLAQAVVYSYANVYLHKIAIKYFSNESKLFSIIITVFWVVPYYLSTYVYGLSLGLSLGIFSIYNMFKYIKYNYKVNFFYSCLFAIFASFVKPNYVILSLTYLLYFLFIKDGELVKKLVISFFCGLNLILSLNIVTIIGNGIFKADLGKGTSQFSFLVMSSIDNSLIDPIVMYYTPPGFHNGYDSRSYLKFDGDYEKINEMNIEILTNQIRYSIEHPQRFIKYYGLKFLSTWASNDFMVLLQYGNRVDEDVIGAKVDFLENGLGKFINTMSINLSCFLIIIGVFFYLISSAYRSNEYASLILIYFLGGVLYHFLFEAKSIYVYPYITLLMPLSINGYTLLTEKFKIGNRKATRSLGFSGVCLAMVAFVYNQSNTYTSNIYENYYNYEEVLKLEENVFINYQFNTEELKNINGLEFYIIGDLGNDTLNVSLIGENVEKYYTYHKGDSENDNYIRINFDKHLLESNCDYILTLSLKCENEGACNSGVKIPYGPSSNNNGLTNVSFNGIVLDNYTINFKLFGEMRSNPFYYDKNVVNPIGYLYYNSFERGH